MKLGKKQLTNWLFYKQFFKITIVLIGTFCAQNAMAQSLEDVIVVNVKLGETLYQYSKVYEVKVDSIIKWNKLKNHRIIENDKILIVNYNELTSTEIEYNQLKYNLEIVKIGIENNQSNYENNLDLLNDKKAQIDVEDPFAMQAILELSKEKAMLKRAYEEKKAKLYQQKNELNKAIAAKESELVEAVKFKNEIKKAKAKNQKAKTIQPKEENSTNDSLITTNSPSVKKESQAKFINIFRKKTEEDKASDEVENKKNQATEVLTVEDQNESTKKDKLAFQNIEKGVSEVLVFDTDISSDVDTSSNKFKRKQTKLLKKLQLESDSSKVDKNIMVNEVAVVREKNKKKYKIGDEVDYINKDKSKFFLSRAMLEIDRYNFKKANEFINKSIKLNPSYVEAYMLKGDMYASMEYFEKAIAAYEDALFLDENIAQVYYNVGNCYVYLNKKAKAIENMGKAVEVDSNYVLAYLGRSSLFIEDKKYQEALADYNKILELNKFFYPALKGRGIAQMNLGEYDLAIIDFNQFLEYDQGDVSIYYHRGMAKMYKNEVYEACLDFLSASEAGYVEADKAMKKYCE